MWILNPYILSVDSQLCEESRLNCKPVYIYTIYQLLQHMEICYHNSNKNECTTGLGCVECLCSSCIWSFMSIHIISQATDEVPMMQQQSVQQQKTAPGVGFQPWVQTHTSHPSHTLPLPFALFQPLHWPPASWTHTHTPSPLCASCLFWSRGFCSVLLCFWPTKIVFLQEIVGMVIHGSSVSISSSCRWLVLNTLWFSH